MPTSICGPAPLCLSGCMALRRQPRDCLVQKEDGFHGLHVATLYSTRRQRLPEAPVVIRVYWRAVPKKGTSGIPARPSCGSQGTQQPLARRVQHGVSSRSTTPLRALHQPGQHSLRAQELPAANRCRSSSASAPLEAGVSPLRSSLQVGATAVGRESAGQRRLESRCLLLG